MCGRAGVESAGINRSGRIVDADKLPGRNLDPRGRACGFERRRDAPAPPASTADAPCDRPVRVGSEVGVGDVGVAPDRTGVGGFGVEVVGFGRVAWSAVVSRRNRSRRQAGGSCTSWAFVPATAPRLRTARGFGSEDDQEHCDQVRRREPDRDRSQGVGRDEHDREKSGRPEACQGRARAGPRRARGARRGRLPSDSRGV